MSEAQLGREAASVLRVMVDSEFHIYRVDGRWKVRQNATQEAVDRLGREDIKTDTVIELLDMRFIDVAENDAPGQAVLKFVASASGQKFIAGHH